MTYPGGHRSPRTAAQVQREQLRAHQEAQRAHAADLTAQLNDWVAMLESVLVRGLARSSLIDLERRRRRPRVPPLDLGADGAPVPRPDWAAYAPVQPGWLGKTFGGDRRYAEQVAAAQARFAAAEQARAKAETQRQARVVELRRRHRADVERAETQAATFNRRLDAWIKGIQQRRREDVEKYLGEVLAAVPLPKDSPRKAEVTFGVDNEHAVVRFQLPGTDMIPPIREVTYVPTKDELRKPPRPARECQRLYQSVISQVSLLVIRDMFDADDQLDKISFNGHVEGTDPATGQANYPCLISLEVDRAEFTPIILAKVDPHECVRKHLKALVSNHPYAVEPVRPLVDFDRSRFAFTHAVDVVAGLDHRDDLMQLTPTEFEHLVRQLFEALPGMQGWTTQASKDDGIDGVIFNNTPITGGLTVVQAKQYSKTVGVDHVRELMGAMEHKRAGRGVLVTTGTFTKDAKLLGEDYGGRIQLIDGPGLVYMMKEHLNKDVLIGRRSKPSPR